MPKPHPLVVTMVLVLCACAPEASGPGRPNVLLIVADDLGRNQVGAYGAGGSSRTPQIDRLAEEGVRLEAGYVMDSICAPSRLALLTGLYPQRSRDRHHLPPGRPTIGDVLGKAGYTTAFVGKWNQGMGAENHP
jgi:arylsulfatase A-like enzyme